MAFLSEKILTKIEQAHALYHRLLMVVGPSGAGKTAAIMEVAKRNGARYINLNLELSKLLLDLTERQRCLQLPRLLDEIIIKNGDHAVLLDNIELLFAVSLKQDPLRLLQGISRNLIIVAAWNGSIEEGHLTYAIPEHPEYRRYPIGDLLIVCS